MICAHVSSTGMTPILQAVCRTYVYGECVSVYSVSGSSEGVSVSGTDTTKSFFNCMRQICSDTDSTNNWTFNFNLEGNMRCRLLKRLGYRRARTLEAMNS